MPNTTSVHERHYWNLVDFRAELAREFARNDGKFTTEEHALLRAVERLIREHDDNCAWLAAGLSAAIKGQNARRYVRQGIVIADPTEPNEAA